MTLITKIVGYSDRLSVQPGETVRFMVSSELSKYRANIVRLIHGDDNPRGPGFKEVVIQTPANREYVGRRQAFCQGSYIVVPDNPVLRLEGSLTLKAFIYPTTPRKGVQGILTKWFDSVGYGLFIDEGGQLALWTGDKSGHLEKVSTGKSLRASTWYFVSGTHDSEKGRVCVYQEPCIEWPSDDSRAVVERSTRGRAVGENDVAFLIAGHWKRHDSRKAVVGGHFNGKIDSPSLFSRALSRTEISSLRQDKWQKGLDQSLIAAWDFAADIPSLKITDKSANQLHGQTVNMPMRGVTGHNWKGKVLDYKDAPDEYASMYFHDDDLDDCRWKVDFRFKVPKRFKSGVYAARLRAGDREDYVPFFVRPKKGTTTARIAFLVPTFSYMAYANEHMLAHPALQAVLSAQYKRGGEYPTQEQDKYVIEHKLVGLYDLHTDGSGVCYSSRLRPILNMRPKYNMQLLCSGQGAPHQFNADLHLTDWMEAKGFKHDVVTDEDLHFEGVKLLAPYKVVVTGTHPEYWSAQTLDALDAYLSNGGRLMYLGGNGFYWVTSAHPELPHIIEVRRTGGTRTWDTAPGEYYHSTSGEAGGIWRNRGRPTQKLVGIGYAATGVDKNVPYRRQPDSLNSRATFIFEGVDSDEIIGDFQSLVMDYGAAGFEIDRLDFTLGTPPHALLLASATGFPDTYQAAVEDILISDSKQGGTVNPRVRADMVYFEYPKGGAVFSVGSIAWCGVLSYNNYKNNVSRITENVLRKFSSHEQLTER